MKAKFLLVIACLWLGVSQASAQTAEEVLESLNWVHGPTTVKIGNNAEFNVPANFVYLNEADTARLMELMENPATPGETYFGPDDHRWYAVFEFEETGYISDDEKIDADAVLDSIREGTEAGNEMRRERGWAPLHITGWKYPPFYDQSTKRLTWAVQAESEGVPVINYNTRILGRSGVTSALLVADVEGLETAVEEFKTALTGHRYLAGHGYHEYRDGDKVAEYGLAALLTGGAAAVAIKSGFLQKFWKLILAGIVVLGAGLGKVFGRKKQ